MENLTNKVGQSILESIGTADTPVSERVVSANATISSHAVDVEAVSAKFETLKGLLREKQIRDAQFA